MCDAMEMQLSFVCSLTYFLLTTPIPPSALPGTKIALFVRSFAERKGVIRVRLSCPVLSWLAWHWRLGSDQTMAVAVTRASFPERDRERAERAWMFYPAAASFPCFPLCLFVRLADSRCSEGTDEATSLEVLDRWIAGLRGCAIV